MSGIFTGKPSPDPDDVYHIPSISSMNKAPSASTNANKRLEQRQMKIEKHKEKQSITMAGKRLNMKSECIDQLDNCRIEQENYLE